MSLPEAPALMNATNGTPGSFSELEVTGPHALALSTAQRSDLLKAELRNAHIELDKTKGLEVHQRIHFQLVKKYKSIYEEYDREKTSLQEDLRIAEELIQSQKQLIELYQGQQQQQPVSHLVQREPVLSQYNDHNHSYQYSPYQPPRNHEFIDPAGLHPLNDFDYSTGFPVGSSYDTEPVMSTPVAEFGNQTPNMSIQSVLQRISAERNVPGPTYNENEETKTVPEDEGVKLSKKRRMK